MSAHAPTKPGFAARKAARSAYASRPTLVESRRHWVGLVTAMAEERLGYAEDYAGCRTRVADALMAARRFPADTFPLGEVSAKHMAEALLLTLKATAAAQIPERVEIYMRAARGVALSLDALLHEDRTRQAENTWKGHGDDA